MKDMRIGRNLTTRTLAWRLHHVQFIPEAISVTDCDK